MSETAHAEPKIWAGARDYAPETVVSIFGISFGADMTLTIKITRPNGSVVLGDGSFLPGSDTVKTDSAGEFVYQYTLDGIKGDYLAEAIYSVGGTDTVLASHLFKDDGGHIETTSAFGFWGGKTTSTGTKHHFSKGEVVWLIGGSNTNFDWKISHRNHVEATGIVSTGTVGVITPDPTKLWDIPIAFNIHVDPAEGDKDEEEERGKYKVRLFKPGKADSIADEGFTISSVAGSLPDYGDAADPLYPTLHDSVGAWHLDSTREWLGTNVDGEYDSNQVDLDNFDDGVTFDPPFSPGSPSNINVIVNTSGLGAARYDINDPTTLLYLNAWADWNGDGDWDDSGEKIIGSGSSVGPAKIDPAAFTGNSKMFTWSVTPPSVIANTFYTRFRLDRGQDGGSLFVGDGMEQSRGKAFHGEVEDYNVDRGVTPVTFTGALMPSATVNSPYSFSLVGANGNVPYTWSVSTGALPVGLSLNPSTGGISGTPVTEGNASFTIQVTDSSLPVSDFFTQPLNLNVGPPANSISIIEPSLPSGIAGTSYSTALTAQSGTGNASWLLISGTLPPGLTLDPGTGVISGTPLTAGVYPFTLQVTDSSLPVPTTDSQAFEVAIDPSVSITWGASHVSPAGIFVHLLPTSTGGRPAYTWSNPLGALPTGVTLDPATGAIWGTPSASGIYSFTLKVEDQDLVFATKDIIWEIVASEVFLDYSVEPGYGMNDAVEPNAGLASQVFLFKVVYKNSLNLPPESIGVFIDSGFFATELEAPCVGTCDFTAGVTYQYFAVLPPGIHSYYFFASDGSGEARLPGTGVLNNLVVTSAGADPLLSFSSEPVYDGTGGVNPLGGDSSTLFKYKVIFEDPDNLPPQTIQLFIDGNPVGNDMTLDLSAAPALKDGDYTNGEKFVFEASLLPGNHFYFFSATDEDLRRVDLSPGSVLQGPVISGTPLETVVDIALTPWAGITFNFSFSGLDATACGATSPEVTITNLNTGTAPPAGFVAGPWSYYSLGISPCALWTSVIVSVNYQDSQIITSESTLRVFHNTLAGNWDDVTSDIDTAHNIARFQATSFSEFILAGDKTTLISLNYFKAKVQGDDVLLTWETASEIDNVGFNIWRSGDMEGEYLKINETLVPGRGNSLSGDLYNYLDKNNSGNASYYRLEEIDSNGRGTLYPETLLVRKSSGGGGGNVVSVEVESRDVESKGEGGCFIGSLSGSGNRSIFDFSVNRYAGLSLSLLLFLAVLKRGRAHMRKE